MILKFGLLVLSYLIGSIPFSVVIGKIFKGIDIRKHGSGNPGGTNTLRYLGKPLGMLTILFDLLKGGWVILLVQFNLIDETLLLPVFAYGVAAALGHVFSIFMNFKGGKAVATTAGMIIAYNPLIALILAVGFFLVLKATRYVSLASSSAAVFFVVAAIITRDWELVPYATFLAVLVVYRHKGNYRNIFNKVEPKITWLSRQSK